MTPPPFGLFSPTNINFDDARPVVPKLQNINLLVLQFITTQERQNWRQEMFEVDEV